MKKIDIKNLEGNVVSMFDDNWCLITAGKKDSYNTMTASWGAMGELWNKDVCFIFIRPQRYTMEFTEKEELFTLSFFSKEYKDALMFCGRNSGRDFDKAKETGLTPIEIDGSMSFKESEKIIVCKKLFTQDIDPQGFIDKSLDSKNYPEKDYHKMYVGEIVSCYIKD
jgi:flavin reductase (DIM6/NTAB) family NADH-FMN oxidoreductase RutF